MATREHILYDDYYILACDVVQFGITCRLRVQFQASPCGIDGGQSDGGTWFSVNTSNLTC